MNIVIIAIIIISIHSVAQNIRQRVEANRAMRRYEEQKRLEREFKEAQRMAKAEAARISAVEKEQKKQAAIIAKHEKDIQDLKNKMKTCEMDYRAMRQRMDNLNELYALASKELKEADDAGDDKRKEKAMRKIMAFDGQIATTEKKMYKAQVGYHQAKRELSKGVA